MEVLVVEERGAVILISGGLDSAVTAKVARSLGYRLHGLTFSYGQRHVIETDRARALAQAFGLADHRVLEIGGFLPGSSALTDVDVAVPEGRSPEDMEQGPIPATYVPARNTIFLAYGLALSEQKGVNDIFLGVNSLDYSGYPDCRPEYLRAFADLARLATRAGVEGARISLRAPLLFRTKAEIIRLGAELGVDFGATWSCYNPIQGKDEGAPLACGVCDSCLLRRRGFEESGFADPTPYAREP
jgi:7-cyano-7-deazaguanine synthase